MAGPFTYPVAVSLPFDGTETSDGVIVTPPFVSDNARDGIIEARNTAIGKVRANRTFLHNGVMSNGFWHGYSELIPSNNTPIIIPWNCILKEYTFAANRTSIDGIMNFYLNGTTTGDIVYSVNFTNVNRTLINFPDLSFALGDLLRLRWVDQGQNPRDVSSTFDFQLT